LPEPIIKPVLPLVNVAVPVVKFIEKPFGIDVVFDIDVIELVTLPSFILSPDCVDVGDDLIVAGKPPEQYIQVVVLFTNPLVTAILFPD